MRGNSHLLPPVAAGDTSAIYVELYRAKRIDWSNRWLFFNVNSRFLDCYSSIYICNAFFVNHVAIFYVV